MEYEWKREAHERKVKEMGRHCWELEEEEKLTWKEEEKGKEKVLKPYEKEKEKKTQETNGKKGVREWKE